MRYALLICQDETVAIDAEERSSRFAAFIAFEEEMTARGVLLGGERLRPTTTATTVRLRAGEVVVVDGPFAETKEQVGGIYFVECRDLDEAIEVASKIPSANRDTIEVRPIWDR